MRLRLRFIVALLFTLFFYASARADTTTALYAGNVTVPSTLLQPFTFTVPAGSTGTLWLGDAGTTPALRVLVFLYTMDGKFYESFSVTGSAILSFPGLPAGDYSAIVSFMYAGGTRGTDYFVANLVTTP